MVIQKLIVHIRQDAFDAPNINPPQLAKSLATFLPNVLFAKVNTLPTIRDVKFTKNFKNYAIPTQEATNQLQSTTNSIQKPQQKLIRRNPTPHLPTVEHMQM